MFKTLFNIICTIILIGLIPGFSLAEEGKEVQDMSDPLAVYTQVGAGYTDKGINLKVGKSYDSGVPATMAMNLFEVKGILSDSLGLRSDLEDDVDSLRFRNFKVNTTNGRGSQVDVIYNLHLKSGSISYSFIQALPKFKIVQFYPLAGLGVAYAGNVYNHPLWSDPNSPSGFSIPGAFCMAGMYSKLDVTDKIWLNYNPIWLSSITGSEAYKDNTYGIDESSVFTHEAAISYQINPRFNVRYFANWSDLVDFSDGDHRVELNYQI